MDIQIKSNKTKNWLYRLRHLKISKEKQPINNKKIVCCRSSNQLFDRNNKTRSSLRKSLKKMHSRVKSCMFKERNSSLSSDDGLPPSPPTNKVETSASSSSKTLDLAKSIVDDKNLERPLPLHQDLEEPPGAVPTDEITNLSKFYWYWGPLTVSEAEDKLQNAPDGAFLVRDSSSTSYLFSISFKSLGKTLHTRIEYSRGRYSLYDQQGFKTIAELIENALKTSQDGVYCYTRVSRLASYPVRFTKPLSRYTQVRSLKYLCRFVIRRCTNINDIPKLPCLPNILYDYLQEGPYF